MATAETRLSPAEELGGNPKLLGERQIAAAEGWAKIYASPEGKGDRSAEIVLRNPTVYSRDVDFQRLSEDLQARWQSLLESADELAARVALEPVNYPSASGLEKLQTQVFGGNINPAPESRYAIAEIMITSSRLFAESVQDVPGNADYYAGNVRGAESWLANAQQRTS